MGCRRLGHHPITCCCRYLMSVFLLLEVHHQALLKEEYDSVLQAQKRRGFDTLMQR